MATTIQIKEVGSDQNGIGIIIELNDGEGLVMDSNVFFTFDQIKDITSWNDFAVNFLKPAVTPLIDKLKKIKTIGGVLTAKIGQQITI